jgi:hypothetical protein
MGNLVGFPFFSARFPSSFPCAVFFAHLPSPEKKQKKFECIFRVRSKGGYRLLVKHNSCGVYVFSGTRFYSSFSLCRFFVQKKKSALVEARIFKIRVAEFRR